jgi:predicted RNase H-like HicB family nuclease
MAMKTLTATIERNESSFFAFIEEIDGCVTVGNSYNEVKDNLLDVLSLLASENEKVGKLIANGYKIIYEIKIDSIFKYLPEINISQLAKLANMNPGLLRQYVSGNKKATEAQNKRVMMALQKLMNKIDSVKLIV